MPTEDMDVFRGDMGVCPPLEICKNNLILPLSDSMTSIQPLSQFQLPSGPYFLIVGCTLPQIVVILRLVLDGV